MTEGFFKSDVDGLKLVTTEWKPEGSIRGVVMLAHGYMEHMGRYAKVAKQLNERGMVVCALDHRGHGKSEDVAGCPRGFFWSFDDVVKDYNQFVTKVVNAYTHEAPAAWDRIMEGVDPAECKKPSIPILLAGHSMGGLVTVKLMLDYGDKLDVAGVALSAPFLAPGKPLYAYEKGGAKLISMIFPRLGVSKIDGSTITRDKKEEELYENDPLNIRSKLTANVAKEFIVTHDALDPRYGEFKAPLLIIHGTGDRLVGIEGSERLYSMAASTDKHMSRYEGGYHELFNEIPEVQKQAISEVADWLEKHL